MLLISLAILVPAIALHVLTPTLVFTATLTAL